MTGPARGAVTVPARPVRSPAVRFRVMLPAALWAALFIGTVVGWGWATPVVEADAPGEIVRQIQDDLAPLRSWLVNDPHIGLDPQKADQLTLGERFSQTG